MKTSDVLRKAGDLLRERGWCQRTFQDDKGRYCLNGAIRAVDGAWYFHAVPLEVTVGCYPNSVASAFNDTPGRTVEEVLIAMDAAYVLQLQEEGIEPGDVL